MSRIKNALINTEQEETNNDFFDEQYHYKQYLKEFEYDSKRVNKKEDGNKNVRLWHWPSDH